jgi:hypothetical protein
MLKIFEGNTLIPIVSHWIATMLEQAGDIDLDWSDLNTLKKIWLGSNFEAKAGVTSAD